MQGDRFITEENSDSWPFVIQRMLCARDSSIAQLFFRIIRDGVERPELMIPGMEYHNLNRGDLLSTNTYFNSFYEAYWAEYTALKNIALCCKFLGSLNISVFRDLLTGSCHKVLSIPARSRPEDVTENTITTLVIPLDSLVSSQRWSPRGRLFFDFLAEEDTQIHEISIRSKDMAIRDVKLSVGLCTFNREEFLVDTLRGLKSAPNIEGRLAEIFVVNQGKPFESAEINSILAEDDRFKLIQQSNLGGCGGFTRTIIESQESDQNSTHLLLMDDDIIFENRILETCIAFLSYAKRPLVLGGHMLDALRPNVMYEAGAFIKPNNRIKAYAHNVDLNPVTSLTLFSGVIPIDYNAWWFCILPLPQTRAINYPAPIFIRGDDFEYGQRLAKNGVPTVSLPGIAVWHEPFYAKPPGWQQYYDLRNRLLFAACYGDRVKIDKPGLVLLNYILEPLLNHNYQRAAFNMQAIEDFLNGPDQLFSVSPEEKHRWLSVLAKNYPILTVAAICVNDLRNGESKPRPSGWKAKLIVYSRRLIACFILPLGRKEPVLFFDAQINPPSVRNRSYVMTNGPRSFYQLFEPSRKNLRAGLRQGWRLYKRYKKEYESAAQTWRDNIGKWQRREVWDRLYMRSEQDQSDRLG